MRCKIIHEEFEVGLMENPLFPTSNRITLQQIYDAVVRTPDLLGIESPASLRSIVVEDRNGDAAHHRTQLVFGGETGSVKLREPGWLELGPVSLLRREIRIDELSSRDGLVNAMLAWTELGDSSQDLEFQDRCWLRRYGSRELYHRVPSWQLELHEQHHDPEGAGPEGPFVSAEISANHLSSLTVNWMGGRESSDRRQIQNKYEIVVEDPRVYIEDIKYGSDGLRVEVDGLQADERQLVICADLEMSRQSREEVVCAVESGAAELELPNRPPVLRVHLVEPPNYWFDRYHEGAHRSLWNGQEKDSEETDGSGARDEVGEMLRRGEDETIEFKKWIPTSRGASKSYELLKAACSFANSKGGTILIGVDDNANVVGMGKRLYENFGDDYGDALDEMRAEYETCLRQWLTEGIEPAVRIDLEWTKVAGQHVLRIDVEQGEDPPYEVFERREIFVRRNATSRRARGNEILQLGREKDRIIDEWG